MLQHNVDLTEAIHSSWRNGPAREGVDPASLPKEPTFGRGGCTSAKWLSPDSGFVRCTGMDAHIVTWDGNVYPKPYGATLHSSPPVGEAAERTPWPHSIRPTWANTAGRSLASLNTEAGTHPTKSWNEIAELAEDGWTRDAVASDSASRRVIALEESWARKRRVFRALTPPRERFAAPALARSKCPLVQDAPFNFGDSCVGRRGESWRPAPARGLECRSDAVELVGTSTHAQPLFRPSFRPTPRRAGPAT